MILSPDLSAALNAVSTGTVTKILLGKGIRNCAMRGPKPLSSDQRVAGSAFTLRFLPAREDLATPEAWARSTRGIEEMPAGVVAVADARGITEAAILGDILAMRMLRGG